MTNLFSMPWHQGTFHAYDTETTGVSVDYDRIVTATFVTINSRAVERHQWLIACPIDIPDGARAVHGISTEHARNAGRPAGEVIREIAAMITAAARANEPVVAYNAVFDFTITDRECGRYGASFDLPRVIDPLVIDKALDKWRKGKRTLAAACDHYNVRLDDAHGAVADALAAGRLAWTLAYNNSAKVGGDAKRLHDKQIQWKREQAESFGAYLIKQGKPDDISREWPIQSPPADWTPQQLPTPREVPA